MHKCNICKKLLREGAHVEVLVRTTYHPLKSKVAYALDKYDMEPIVDTLVHTECADTEDFYTGEQRPPEILDDELNH